MAKLKKRYTREQKVHLKRLNLKLNEMPFYIGEFVRESLSNGGSPSTYLGYLHNYETFFNWVRAEGLLECAQIKDIPYSFLETIPKQDIVNFKEYLMTIREWSDSAINRMLSSLKALFRYLTTETENDDGECYFYRNVMAKIPLILDKEDASIRAGEISKEILKPGDDLNLIDFVENEYMGKIKGTAKERYYKRDRERDIAIFALFLASGLRVSELANLEQGSIDFKDRYLSILRKGSKKSTIVFEKFALPYLESYRAIRNERYRGSENDNEAFFLTLYDQKGSQISVRALQTIVKKYTAMFDKKISPHKLRHTFATNLIRNGLSMPQVMFQLGHNSMNTTKLYTNPALEETKAALDEFDRNK